MDTLTFGAVDTSQAPSSRQVGEGFLWEGAWSGSTAYEAYDVVSYGSTVWVALVANSGVTPGTDSSKWGVMFTGPLDYPIAVFTPGIFNTSQEVIKINLIRAFTLPVNCVGSYATLDIAPADATKVFSIKKNGSQVGTITFSTGSGSGVFAMASQQSFSPGDFFSIIAPAVQDSAAAGLAVTLLGTKVV